MPQLTGIVAILATAAILAACGGINAPKFKSGYLRSGFGGPAIRDLAPHEVESVSKWLAAHRNDGSSSIASYNPGILVMLAGVDGSSWMVQIQEGMVVVSGNNDQQVLFFPGKSRELLRGEIGVEQ